MLYSIVAILVIILDQATKFWVSDTLFGTDVVRFIPGVVSLVNVHNDGAAFGILSGSGARVYFIAATGVFVLLVIIALATNFIRGSLARWSLVLVAAGGVGNMIDRVIYGYVQDMFKVELFNFAIFNVADIFITVFAILFALAMIFEKPDDPADELYEDEEEVAPKKLSRKEKKALKAAAKEQADADGDEEEPVKNSAAFTARKARQDKYEKEYEEYKAQQRAAMEKKKKKKRDAEPEPEAQPVQPAPAPAPKQATAAPAFQPVAAAPKQQAVSDEDPFAAWERANARVEANQSGTYAGRVMDVPAAPKPAQSAARRPAPAPQRPVQSAPKAAPEPQRPVQSAPKAPAPQPKSESAEEFNLDDILAEFR